MAITIKEIAELAGTSRGTVDRVFNNRGKVKKELADKIKKIAKEHNYTPNTTAKYLVASQKKFVIGVIINSIGNAFFDEVKNGVMQAEHKWKNNITIEMIELEGYDEAKQLQAIDELMERNIDALAITPVASGNIVNKLNKLIDGGVQVAFINSDLEPVNRIFMVGANNTKCGNVAGNLANLMFEQGSKIAVVAGSKNNLSNKKRVEGFTDVVGSNAKHLRIIDVVENGDSNELSYKLVSQLIEKNTDLHGIYFCAGGINGGLKAIEESGKNIKSITVDMSQTIETHINNGDVLATITQDPFQQGYLPIEVLVEYLVTRKKPTKSKIHTENKIVMKYNI